MKLPPIATFPSCNMEKELVGGWEWHTCHEPGCPLVGGGASLTSIDHHHRLRLYVYGANC